MVVAGSRDGQVGIAAVFHPHRIERHVGSERHSLFVRVVHIAVGTSRPTLERVARAGKRIRIQRLGNPVRKPLNWHGACATIGVERNRTALDLGKQFRRRDNDKRHALRRRSRRTLRGNGQSRRADRGRGTPNLAIREREAGRQPRHMNSRVAVIRRQRKAIRRILHNNIPLVAVEAGRLRVCGCGNYRGSRRQASRSLTCSTCHNWHRHLKGRDGCRADIAQLRPRASHLPNTAEIPSGIRRLVLGLRSGQASPRSRIILSCRTFVPIAGRA